MEREYKIRSILIAAGLVFGLAACAPKPAGQSNATVDNTVTIEAVPVKTVTALIGRVEDCLELNGQISGRTEVKVFPKIPGKLIEKKKKTGDRVVKDEILALVDRDEPALDFKPVEVKSPSDGVIIAFEPAIGNVVSPSNGMNEPLAVVADISSVKVIAYLAAADLGRVRLDQAARVKVPAWPEQFEGRVTDLASAADPATGKFKIEAELANPDQKLKPGMFADTVIVTAVRDGVVKVPRQAVTLRMDRQEAFVYNNGIAQVRVVKTGAADARDFEIVKGVKAGDEVIVEGNYGLTDGARVSR